MKNKPVKLFPCPDCGRDFPSKYTRKSHICGIVARKLAREKADSRELAMSRQRDASRSQINRGRM